MKKKPHILNFWKILLLLLVGLFLTKFTCQGQTHELIGLGTLSIFSVSADGSKANVLKGLDEGIHPTSRRLTLAQDKLWGLTTDDGFSDAGTIFSIRTDGTGYLDVHHFPLDINSNCQLVWFQSKLWGTTNNGGTEGLGTIFSFDPTTLEYTRHFDFLDLGTQKHGRQPGSLVAVGEELWGVCHSGGENMKGTLFKYNVSAAQFEKIHDFETGDGPHADLTMAGTFLWGTTQQGGDNDLGVIYTIDTENNTISIVYHLTAADGENPSAALTAYDGNMYGVTTEGGANNLGTIYKINEAEGFTKLMDFSAATGGTPVQSMVWVDSVFVGLTSSDLTEDLGGFYAFNPESETLRVLREFDELDEYRSGMILVGEELWGTTYNSGAHAKGSIFSYQLNTEQYKTAFDFGNHPGNASALSELLHANGRYWGTTQLGGTHNSGVLFSIDEDGSDFTMNHHFTLIDGNPLGSLQAIDDDRFWGVLIGAGQHGAIYEYNHTLQQFSIIHYFDQQDGNVPYSGLTKIDDQLWGVTELGGANNMGVIYKVDLNNSNDVTVVHEFDGTDGQLPHGDLTLFNGRMYGTTTAGGNAQVGTLFSVDVNSLEFAVEHYFTAQESVTATGGLTAFYSRLWGISQNGGQGAGTIFAYDPKNQELEVVHEFSGEDGAVPSGSLTLLDNNLYGTTFADGEYYDGVLFVITDETTQFLKLRDFDKSTGGKVLFGRLLSTGASDPDALVWDGNQWQGGVSPQINDDVRLAGDYTCSIDGNLSVNNLYIDEFELVTVDAGHTLEVHGHLISHGVLLIESGGTLITYEGNMHGGLHAFVERNTRFDNGRYSFVGTPMKASSLITGETMGMHVYSYDESRAESELDLSRWVDAASDTLKPGKGYTQTNMQFLTFGGIPNDGTITYTGTYENDGWHLVSNPYPAAIELDAFLDANTNTTGAIYLWDDNGSDQGRGTNNDYVVVNKVGAVDLGGENNEHRWNGYIGSSQGFFIQLDGAAGTVVFTEDMRVAGHNLSDNFYRTALETVPYVRLDLATQAGTHLSQCMVAWKSDVPGNLPLKGYDAPVFNAHQSDLLFVPQYGKKLSIHTTNLENMQVPIGFHTATNDSFTLTITEDRAGDLYYLRDLHAGTLTAMPVGKPYTFHSKAGEFNDRFELVAAKKLLANQPQDSPRLFVYDKQVRIHGELNAKELRIVDLAGQLVGVYPDVSNGTVDLTAIRDGVYLLIYGDAVQKVLLK
ncbi:choice-of-anchor tandem repeat GloVer-containing protein [Marinoscillum furvescens]|uniref:Putative repeat protein (TIGR03803 family) n=1 Tax=Marinoscillum furvescens DSM 4134 TaxID=1122208 RepID=A0A3D9L1F8_MARFU|nr:choice-of-anchor tandem repeat GloVer-containing protein [Marinoscillum furvescens]RED97885.1 putative repeat protein (TIGR03803 family) [Marinoscillum furvescens DSM 4134]